MKKKLLSWLLALAMVFTLAACGEKKPDLLPEMVKRAGAHSTDLEAPESAEHLCEKCKAYAAAWKPCAEELWDEEHPKKEA